MKFSSFNYRPKAHYRPKRTSASTLLIIQRKLRTADARIKISGLKNCSFSHDVPEDGLAKISGYLHVDRALRLYESAAVQTWIFDDQISREIEWTLVLLQTWGLKAASAHLCCLRKRHPILPNYANWS